MTNLNYKHFFQNSSNSSDLKFIGGIRQAQECAFLVDGVATFQAMEKAILEAKKQVFLSFWIFNPRTKLLYRKARSKKLSRWIHLLKYKAKQNVKVYIYLNDFDPVLQDGLHSYAWKSFKYLRNMQKTLSLSQQNNFQVITIRHEANGAPFYLQSRLKTKLDSVIKKFNNRKESTARWYFERSPGLWPYIKYDTKKKKYSSREKKISYHPAAHHQKYCVVDEELLIAGGLDVNSGRIDTPRHNYRKTAWHDVDIKVKGEIAKDAARNFIGIWNHNKERFHNFLKNANKEAEVKKIDFKQVDTLNYNSAISNKKIKSVGYVQCHRTLSQAGWFFKPDSNILDDVMQNYKKVISKAEKYIYIENQYVRHLELANWIIKRCSQMKDLVVILVVPVAPEEVSAKGGADPVTNHGIAMQHTILTKLSKLLKNRFGVYSMIQIKKSLKKHPTDSFGSNQIYVHSKVLIVDDVYASVGSANANGRSFLVDSELTIGTYSPPKVKSFRKKLWSELLGSPKEIATWKPQNFISNWNQIADHNKNSTVRRKGFIVPHTIDRFKGKYDTFIPNKYAEVMDLEINKDEVYLEEDNETLA